MNPSLSPSAGSDEDKPLRAIDPNEGTSPPSLPKSAPVASTKKKKPARLISLDAFRGFIMFVLAAHGFGIAALARSPADSPVWKIVDRNALDRLAFHFTHSPWQSSFVPGSHNATIGTQWMHWGVPFWDLIQPAFMFMVGVALPLSLARRKLFGQSAWRRGAHALVRAIVLVLLGVFLYSEGKSTTNWIFPNVLAQIGLGYFFVYLLVGRRLPIQLLALVVILVGTWGLVHLTPPDVNYHPDLVNAHREQGEVFAPPYRQWSKNGNVFHTFDVWFLNLFPRPAEEGPFEFNRGGYQTLNFIPSMATMLIGVLCGQLLLTDRSSSRKFFLLVLMAFVLWGLGVAAGATCCPVVKRIWTPSWVLFSGGYVVGMLALFYLVFDVWGLRRLAFPLVIIGANSLLVYLLGELLTSWLAEGVRRHFGTWIEAGLGWLGTRSGWSDQLNVPSSDAGAVLHEAFSPVIAPVSAALVIWLFCYWLYRQKIFLRI